MKTAGSHTPFTGQTPPGATNEAWKVGSSKWTRV